MELVTAVKQFFFNIYSVSERKIYWNNVTVLFANSELKAGLIMLYKNILIWFHMILQNRSVN